MKKVGITGGIGSGKSTVCIVFESLGIPIYQADLRAKFLMQNDPILIEALISTFGNDSYLSDGQLNRDFLAHTVFRDQKELEKINALVHPVVDKDFDRWVKQQNSKYVLKEAALLIESGSYKKLDYLINVYAPVTVRVSRVQKRNPKQPLKEIHRIIEQQTSEEVRNHLSDITIHNDGSSLIIPQVLGIHQRLMS